jgi:hypothetical protein
MAVTRSTISGSIHGLAMMWTSIFPTTNFAVWVPALAETIAPLCANGVAKVGETLISFVRMMRPGTRRRPTVVQRLSLRLW